MQLSHDKNLVMFYLPCLCCCCCFSLSVCIWLHVKSYTSQFGCPCRTWRLLHDYSLFLLLTELFDIRSSPSATVKRVNLYDFLRRTVPGVVVSLTSHRGSAGSSTCFGLCSVDPFDLLNKEVQMWNGRWVMDTKFSWSSYSKKKKHPSLFFFPIFDWEEQKTTQWSIFFNLYNL